MSDCDPLRVIRAVMSGAWRLIWALVFVAALLPASGALGQATPTPVEYVIHELPTLGGDNGAVVEINSAGVAVGWSEVRPGDDEAHATLWAGGEPIDLGTLGGDESMAIDINDAGVVVGHAETADGDVRAVIWRDGTIGGLGTLGGDNSSARAINADGTVVGRAENADGEAHAFLWRNGVMTDLGTLGGPRSDAMHITEDGVVYGTSDTASGPPPSARWEDGGVTRLGTLGGDASYAMAANSSGVVVGYATQPNGTERALIWRNGSLAEIDPDDPTASVAAAINDQGNIAGSIASSTPEMRAVVWKDGKRILLPGFVDDMSGAFGITEAGVVGGYAADAAGHHRPVVWIPNGAPTPAALVGASQAATPATPATPVNSAGAPAEAVREAGTGDGDSGVDVAVSNQLTVVSYDIYFEPEAVAIPANTDVTFVLPNQGVIPHNFSIDALGISVDQAPGTTEEVVVNAPAGEYEFYCNVPGHREAGMVGTLIVTEDADAAAAQAPAADGTPVPQAAATPTIEATPEADGAEPAAAAAAPVEVVSYDIYFEPTEIEVPSDTEVTILLPNRGAAPHNFSIDALGIDVDIAPGETKEVTFTAPEGKYEYYCNVPGHTEAGMVGTLIVREATPAAPVLAGTPVAPSANPTPAPRSFVWDQVDVTVELREDSSFHITERNRVAFTGGPFRSGIREIPLARVERFDHVRVGEVEGAFIRPYRFVAPDDFSPTTPNTYTWREVGPNLRIDWSFPETTSASRTFQLEYDAFGALRVYADADPPYQQISWIGVDDVLTETAPVNEASLTFVLPRAIDLDTATFWGPGGNRAEDHTEDGQTWVWRASDLGPGESLEAGLRFPPLVPAEEPSWQEASDRAEGAGTDEQAVITPVLSGTPVAMATPVAGRIAFPPCRVLMENDFPGQRRDLRGDCTTDRTIFVPEGWVFDGGGHGIYARDPDGGRLTGGVVTVSGDGSTVRNLTVDGSGLSAPCLVDAGATSLAGVLVRGGDAEISGVTVRNLARVLPSGGENPNDPSVKHSCGTGIAVAGDSAQAFVTENAIENASLAGILIDGGTASISHNAIDRVAEFGVLAMNGANVRVSPGNRISNGRVGIQLEGIGTGGRVAGNTITAMARSGIAVILGGRAAVADNTIEDAFLGIETSRLAIAAISGNTIRRTENSGIFVSHPGAQATLEDNIIDAANSDGIWVQEGAQASILGNTVTGAARYGVAVFGEETRVTIDGNTVQDSGEDGIRVGHGSAVITSNVVTDAAQDGILVSNGADASIAENRVSGGERGIEAAGTGTKATITGNTVAEVSVPGITINRGAAAPDVSGNTVTGARFGIVTLNAGTTATVTENTVSDLSGTGFTVESGAAAELRGNHVSDAGWGILVTSAGTTAELTENQIEDMNTEGISVNDGARATVVGNTLLRPGTNGIEIDEAGHVTLEDNTIRDADRVGIRLERTRAVSATGDSVVLASRDIYYEPDEITIPADTDVTLVLPNEGVVMHNVTIEDLGIDVDIAPGNIEEILVNAPAGTYEIFCSVPGHREAGQVATLTVTGAPQETASDVPVEPDVIRDNEVTGGEFGIVATGSGATVTVAKNTITGASEIGISIEHGADATVEGNFIAEAGMGILLTRIGTSGALVRNRIIGSAERGIYIQSGAEATVRQNTVTQAGTNGIAVNGRGTSATLSANAVSNAAETGISVEAEASATIEDGNSVVGGRWGINILGDGTTAEVRGNRVRDADSQSITVLYGARATIADNSIFGGDSGIYVRFPGSRAVITGNSVDAERRGIYVWEEATAERIADNFVIGSSSGIVIEGQGSRAVVEDNSVSTFAREGIAVRDGATAEVTGNRVRRNGGSAAWGIIVAGPGTAATIAGNEISDIDGIAIQISQSATGTVRDNRVRAIANTGIRVMDAAHDVLVSENTLQEAGTVGIEARLSDAAIQDNTVEGATFAGIQFGVGAEVEVTGNTIVGPAEPNADDSGPYGVHIQRDAHGTVSGNRISEVVNQASGTGCAISIDANAPDVRVADNVFPAPGNDQDVCDERIAEPGATPAPAATPIAATPLADDLLVPSATGHEDL